MLRKVVLLLVLICLGAVFSAEAMNETLTFVGKIEEIAIKTTMTPLGAMEKNLSIKIDSQPKMEFRATPSDAASFGIIDSAQLPAVLTPGKIKGVGWKVRLTCDKKEVLAGPSIYLVTKLERLD